MLRSLWCILRLLTWAAMTSFDLSDVILCCLNAKVGDVHHTPCWVVLGGVSLLQSDACVPTLPLEQAA